VKYIPSIILIHILRGLRVPGPIKVRREVAPFLDLTVLIRKGK
jgi:hypothetical protein